MSEDLTFKKRDLVVAVLVIFASLVIYALAMPKSVPIANAAGGGSDTPANACVAPVVGSASDAVTSTTSTSTEPTKATETSEQSTTKTVTKTETHVVSDLVKVKVGDVTVGNILSDNLSNNDVDVNVSDVVDGGILNPVTNLLGSLKVL